MSLRLKRELRPACITAVRILINASYETTLILTAYIVYRFYQAYWRDGRDFSQDDVILSILKDGGVANPQAVLDKYDCHSDCCLTHCISSLLFSTIVIISSHIPNREIVLTGYAVRRASTNHVKEMLQNVTQELVDRKGFGVPSFFVTIGDETEYIYGQV